MTQHCIGIGITFATMPSSHSTLLPHCTDEKSKWIENIGIDSVVRSTAASIPPLVHIPAPVVTRVLYGRQTLQGTASMDRRLRHIIWMLS